MLGSAFSIKLTAIAALAIIAKAFVSRISNTEAINQDGRNAERYNRTAVTLKKLRNRLNEVRRQVSAGNFDILSEFVEAVHDQLSLEHRQWLETISQAGTAYGNFEHHLEQLVKN